jgi:hypothetical protein
MLKFRYTISLLLSLIFASLLATACGPAATPSPVVLTVVQTVPVEVTRLAEVTQMVEVTRQVVVTQLVEVAVTPPVEGTAAQGIPMTQTPVSAVSETPVQGIPMTQTPTPPATNSTAGQATLASAVTPYNWITPDAKGQGFTPVFIENQTDYTMKIAINGPLNMEVTVAPGRSQLVWLRRGNYTFQTWKDDRKSYSGSFSIVSADKYQLFLRDSKAVLWVP